MTERSDGTCTMCKRPEVMVRHLPLYVTGSEGIMLCEICEDALDDFIGMYMRIFMRQKIEARKKERKAKLWEVWSEGYRATGQWANAKQHGPIMASTFKEACNKLFEGREDYDSNRLTLWGCCLFNNEADARKTFG